MTSEPNPIQDINRVMFEQRARGFYPTHIIMDPQTWKDIVESLGLDPVVPCGPTTFMGMGVCLQDRKGQRFFEIVDWSAVKEYSDLTGHRGVWMPSTFGSIPDKEPFRREE